MPRLTRPVAVLVALLLGVTATACGADDPGSPASGASHNEADVAFATGMIPHHAQALHMAEMADERVTSADFGRLVDDVEQAQGPEIEQMTGWLREWGEEVPPTDPAAVHGGHGAHADHDGPPMPGMMSDRDLDRLDRTEGPAFEQLWMRMMIEHHEGAIEMAEAAQRQGQDPDVVALAQEIVETQRAEITRMEDLLRG